MASIAEGIGVPSSPVNILVCMSSTLLPPLKIHASVRSAARMGRPRQSSSVGAEVPSPRPDRPWHSSHSIVRYAAAPASIAAGPPPGSDPKSSGSGAGPWAKNLEKLFR